MSPHHYQKINILHINIKKSKLEITMQLTTLIKPSLMKDVVIHHQYWDNNRKKTVFFYFISESKPAKESKEKLSEKKAVYYSIKNFKP